MPFTISSRLSAFSTDRQENGLALDLLSHCFRLSAPRVNASKMRNNLIWFALENVTAHRFVEPARLHFARTARAVRERGALSECPAARASASYWFDNAPVCHLPLARLIQLVVRSFASKMLRRYARRRGRPCRHTRMVIARPAARRRAARPCRGDTRPARGSKLTPRFFPS